MNKNLVIGIVLFVAGFIFSYFLGSMQGYRVGYNKAIGDAKSTQEALGQKAAEDAANAANPFKVTNPLEGVEANPFDETAKKLNPFAK